MRRIRRLVNRALRWALVPLALAGLAVMLGAFALRQLVSRALFGWHLRRLARGVRT